MIRQSRAPLIVAIALLSLPLLYVGSYLALVVPNGRFIPTRNAAGVVVPNGFHRVHYRVAHDIAYDVFWPLEQIDRRCRKWDQWEEREDEGVLLGGSS